MYEFRVYWSKHNYVTIFAPSLEYVYEKIQDFNFVSIVRVN